MIGIMTNTVHLEVSEGIARITLNRPERLNAFDERMADAWATVTRDAVTRDDVGVILLRAEGRAFCAGGDVRAMAQLPDRKRDLEGLAARINDGIRALVHSDRPVVAAVHGTTAGGGLGILLSTDVAIVGESAKIGSLYANVGLTPDLSVTALLSRAIGERRALQLTLGERMLSAEEALDWGLVAEVVPDECVSARAEEIARHWAENATWAYGQAKRLIRSSPSRTFDEQLAEEARTIGIASITSEADRRILAFAGKGQ